MSCQRRVMPFKVLIWPLFMFVTTVSSQQRSLSQADGPGIYNKPLSATPEDLLNDPSGRAHLLAKLGNPPEYFGSYPYPLPEGQYAIDPKIDPNIVSAIPGNDSPTNGSFKVVGNSGMISVHAIPFSNGKILFFGRPAEPYGGGDPAGPGIHYLTVANGTWTEIAAIYNTVSNTFEPFHIPEAPFCGAQTILPDGRGIIVGGEHINLWYPYLQYGLVSVRIYDPATHTIDTVATMDRGRWYPSVMTMPDGNILIVGGGQQEIGGWGVSDAATSKGGLYETSDMLMGKCVPNGGGSSGDPYWDNPSFTIYNVTSNSLTPSLTLTILLEAYPINLYPYLFLMPTGSVLIVTGVQMGAMYLTADGATQDEAIGYLPKLPYPVGPNQYTPVTMLTLSPPGYEVRILVAGGTSEYCANTKSPANNQSYLIDVSPGANHSIVTENLAYPRIMGELTNLPDGRVFLCNGAQIGLGGGGGPRYSNMKNFTTVAEVYDPSQPIGQRWTTVGDTQIPRLYHSVAFLTPNAEVLISGSETSSERRVQIWTPDYLLNGKPRPSITSAPSSVAYSGIINISYSNVTVIDRVVLIRPSSATHGLHFDERAVVVNCSSSGSTSIACTAPPNSNIAPPGQYMLFILSDGVPSVANYISLPIALSSEAAPPLTAISTGVNGTITGPTSAPLAAEAPQGPSAIADPEGTAGEDPPGFAEAAAGLVAPALSSSNSASSSGNTGSNTG
ncbi:TPA: hypothetical protein ACH3X3_005878 [Trebouxia sp. C0006]